MKIFGAAAVVAGFLLWFGGDVVNIAPYNLIGIPMLFAGAVLYFIGRRRVAPASNLPPPAKVPPVVTRQGKPGAL